MKTKEDGRNWSITALGCALAMLVLASAGSVGQARAETKEVRISRQFGLPYLPVDVALEHKLIEKHAIAQGLPDVKVSGVQLSGAAVTNDALLSGSIDLAAAGIGGLLQMWDKTNGNVKAIVSLNDMAMLLNTNDPRIKNLKDYIGITDEKIAVPAIKISIQAIILQMAAAKTFGSGKQFTLDNMTVSMPHPEAYAALVSGHSAIRSHVANLPYSYLELKHKNIHTVFSSYDILGGPHVNILLYATNKWVENNPKLLKAVFGAFEEADDWIKAHPQEAAALFKKVTKSKLQLADIEAMIQNPKLTDYAPEPKATMKFARFLHKIGRIKKLPVSWKDYFWDIAHQMNGS